MLPSGAQLEVSLSLETSGEDSCSWPGALSLRGDLPGVSWDTLTHLPVMLV